MSEITAVNLPIEEPENTQRSSGIPYPNIKSTIRLFFITLLIWVAVAIAGNVITLCIPKGFPLITSILKLFFESISMIPVIFYALKKGKKEQGSPQSIYYNKIQAWLIPALIIAAPAFSVIIEPTSVWIPMPKSVQKIFEEAFTKDIFSLIATVIVAPIVEEILCRGILLKGLLNNYSPNKAIIISAVFFSVLHLNPWQSIPAFFGGLFLGWLYYKTQSVITGMIFHAAINGTAYVLLYFADSQENLSDIFGAMYYPVLLISLAIFTVITFLIHKKAYPVSKPKLISIH